MQVPKDTSNDVRGQQDRWIKATYEVDSITRQKLVEDGSQVRLWRGCGRSELTAILNKARESKDGTITIGGFLSASTNARSAEGFRSHVEIDGVRQAMSLEFITSRGTWVAPWSKHKFESEVLLGRNRKWRIAKHEYKTRQRSYDPNYHHLVLEEVE